MELSIKLLYNKTIVYMYMGYNFKKNLSLKIDFLFANSARPDEIQHYAAFYLGIHCLSKYTNRLGVHASGRKGFRISQKHVTEYIFEINTQNKS